MIGGLLLMLACSGSADDAAAVDTTAASNAAAQCDVCAMTVAEQPSPRAQVVYRDGARAHFCSLGELRAALQAPSPHGSAVATYVEALPADFDPAANTAAPLPWIPAEDAWYVFGAERPLVMGLPVLSFADEAAARESAQRLGREPVAWTAVRETPFNQTP